MDKSQYLRWLWVADKWPEHQMMCETMARLACRASRLNKGDNPLIKGAGFQSLLCTRYVLGIVEDLNPYAAGGKCCQYKIMQTNPEK